MDVVGITHALFIAGTYPHDLVMASVAETKMMGGNTFKDALVPKSGEGGIDINFFEIGFQHTCSAYNGLDKKVQHHSTHISHIYSSEKVYGVTEGVTYIDRFTLILAYPLRGGPGL